MSVFHSYYGSVDVYHGHGCSNEIEHELIFEIVMLRLNKAWPASADDPGAPSEWEFYRAHVGGQHIPWSDFKTFLGDEIADTMVEDAANWARSSGK